MNVATLLAIAASFWSGHGYAVQPVTWDWNMPTVCAPRAPGCVMSDDPQTIHLRRESWDFIDSEDKCILVIHETGHTIGLGHSPGGIMDADDMWSYEPGVCKQFKPKPKRAPVNPFHTSVKPDKAR